MKDALTDISLKKLPPHHKEAEQCVLGACLLSGEALSRALELLTAPDFYLTAHQKVFAAMEHLFQAHRPVDILTLSEKLRQGGDLDTAGGLEYLNTLETIVPTAEAVSHHAKIVREKKVLRDLIESATQIVTDSFEDQDDVENLLDRAEQTIFRISEQRSTRSFFRIQEVVDASFEHLERLFEKPGLVTGVETGFADLDRMTSGFQPSDLIIIAARPSMGKTSFALDIARFAALKGGNTVAIFSLEMAKEQLGVRMLCAEAKVNSMKLRTGFLAKSDWPSLTSAAGRMESAKIYIDDTPALTVLDIRARSRRLQAEQNGIGLIIVDYLQLMHVRGKTESRQLEISEISRGLKALAKELNVPVVALSQLSRAVEHRTDKRPVLADLRESGAIEQDADVVLFIYRDEVYNPDKMDNKGVAEILIRKQRNGPTGDVQLTFLGEYTSFVSSTHMEGPPPEFSA